MTDTGRAIALLACLLTALIGEAGPTPSGFLWMEKIAGFLEPAALPAFLTFAGVAGRDCLCQPWGFVLRRQATPAFLAAATWAGLAVAVLLVARRLDATSLLVLSLRAATSGWSIPELVILPAALLAAFRAARGVQPVLIIAFAVLLEVWNVRTGLPPLDTALHHFIYFAVGMLFASRFHALAAWSAAHRSLATVILSVWGVYNAIASLRSLPILDGGAIASLPLAGLGVGFAGGAAATMAAGVLSHRGSLLRIAGHPNAWPALAVATPLVVAIAAWPLEIAGLAPGHGGAVAIFIVVICAAVFAYAAMALIRSATAVAREEFFTDADARSRKENATVQEPDAPFRSRWIQKRYDETQTPAPARIVSQSRGRNG